MGLGGLASDIRQPKADGHTRHLLKGKRWERFRKMILDRDRWRCTVCGSARRLEVHHLNGRKDEAATFDPGNVQTLCRQCHFAAHPPERYFLPEFQAWQEFINSRKEVFA